MLAGYDIIVARFALAKAQAHLLMSELFGY
jgi:hypothetical protein